MTMRTLRHKTPFESAHRVLLGRNYLKVLRVDAMTNSAKMVDLLAVGNWPDKQLVSDAMRSVWFSPPGGELAIAASVFTSGPEPATVFGLYDFREKPFALLGRQLYRFSSVVLPKLAPFLASLRR
jgi:hypothetical protein